MRKRISGLFLVGALLLAPTNQPTVRTKTMKCRLWISRGPLSHPRYERGGIFGGIQGLYWREGRPLASQTVAFRGFVDVDGSVTGTPGTFVGSHSDALNVNQLRVRGRGSRALI